MREYDRLFGINELFPNDKDPSNELKTFLLGVDPLS
jgi:hypothetical protein